MPTPPTCRKRQHVRRAAELGWLLIACAACGGCRPAHVATANAVAWDAADRDPHETGENLDRWPGWRGTDGSGVASGGHPAVEFSPTQHVCWRIPVPGPGNSSPVIWGRDLFLTAALEKTDPPRLVVLCLDRQTGATRWQVEAAQAAGRTHAKNGYASATLTTDGERVYAFFGAGGLFCFDRAGKLQWKADLGPLDHMWGTASSPILVGDRVVQLGDSSIGGFLAAFDKRSGKQLWRTVRQSTACWTTPVVIEAMADGTSRPEIVVNGTGTFGDGQVIAYAPADGRELWRASGTTALVTPTLLSADGLVFSLSGRNGPVFAIRPGGNADVTDTRVVWKNARGGPYIPSGVVYRRRLYLVGDNGVLTCINPGNGATIWQDRLPGTFSSSLVAANGRIYAVNEIGVCYVFAAADHFQLLATNRMGASGDRCLATPAFADGRLYLRTQSYLYCIQGQ